MKKQVLTFVLVLIGATIFAQSKQERAYSANKKTTVTKTVTESTDYKSYIGLSGGYLFKSDKVLSDPMLYLGSGKFLELNVGTRGKIFGWSAALGYLEIERDLGQINKVWLNTRMMYDSVTAGTKPANITSGLDVNSVSFTPDSIAHKPFRGFYALTGPNIWLGNGKLQFNLALEGGIGYSQAGYYYVSGAANKGSNAFQIEGTGPTGKAVTYDVLVNGAQYAQYGMSKDYFDKISSSTLANPFAEEESREIHFMARLTGNVEYFITPRLSIHGGANFWYISMPEMVGQQEVRGVATYMNKASGVGYQNEFSYTKPYEQKDVMNLSANIGLKYWFGRRNSKKVVKTEEVSTSTKLDEMEQVQEAKTVLITVVDKLTNTPMGDVRVTLNGQTDIVALTEANGTVKLEDVAPGNYEVNGEIFNISTTSAQINAADFSDDASVIRTTLYYNDPRFILKGVAVNIDNGTVEDNVRVNLENKSEIAANTTTNLDGNFKFLLDSNSDYQVQGLKNGLFSNTVQVSTKGLERSQTLYVKLKLGMNTVEVGRTFEIKNIHYDFDDASIRPDAARILDRVVAFLNANPDVRIELSSHTDSRGSDAYNLKLSQRRAQSAVDYLVSQGISRSRLEAKGYGESRLLNGCDDGVPCTKAQHQANRRTTITIIK